MNKKINLIIGSGVLGAYLSKELLKKREKIVVTSRSKKTEYKNYKFLDIQKKINFEKLNVLNKKEVKKIIEKYSPYKIFYFAGQSSLTKSSYLKKETYDSHYIGVRNFLEIIEQKNLKSKFFKANSGYIFKPKNGEINLNCKYTKNNNPYIVAQKKTFELVNDFRKLGFKTFNLVFFQVESPLRPNDFLIKKICIGAKNKKKITLGNLNTYRDYSWATEIAKAIFLTSKLNGKNIILSSGKKMSGKEALKIAYSFYNLDYKDFFKIDKKFFRNNEDKIMCGNSKNHKFLKKKFNFKLKIFKNLLIKKMLKEI